MDKALLEYEMKKKHITIGEMCKKLGISRSAFYRKCSGKTQFTVGEMQTIIEFLQPESPTSIFFN